MKTIYNPHIVRAESSFVRILERTIQSAAISPDNIHPVTINDRNIAQLQYHRVLGFSVATFPEGSPIAFASGRGDYYFSLSPNDPSSKDFFLAEGDLINIPGYPDFAFHAPSSVWNPALSLKATDRLIPRQIPPRLLDVFAEISLIPNRWKNFKTPRGTVYFRFQPDTQEILINTSSESREILAIFPHEYVSGHFRNDYSVSIPSDRECILKIGKMRPFQFQPAQVKETAQKMKESMRRRANEKQRQKQQDRTSHNPKAVKAAKLKNALQLFGFVYIPNEQELRAAFHKISRQCHPDLFQGDKTKERELQRYSEAHLEILQRIIPKN